MPTLLSSLSLMWAMIAISTIFINTPQHIKMLILFVGGIGTATMVYIYKKKKRGK
jgi:archaellum biogenesis protein FlaJ (TadC family)